MRNNDYFTVAYKILSYLRKCYENGEDADPNILTADTFKISKKQFLRTLQMLLEDGYIKGLSLESTIGGPTIVSNLSWSRITSSGLQYLSENSMMKKAYKALKEVRDWLS